jgi:hypothetical protein
MSESWTGLFLGGFPQMPHCDQSVLHAPGECQFCDMHSDWQEYRIVARINFTGQSIEDCAPCPSEFFRSGEVRDRWPGNVAAPEGEPVPSYWPADQAEFVAEFVRLGERGDGSYSLAKYWEPGLLEQINAGQFLPGSYHQQFGTDQDQEAYRDAHSDGWVPLGATGEGVRESYEVGVGAAPLWVQRFKRWARRTWHGLVKP